MADKLARYRDKRDFAATAEPAGEGSAAGDGGRFVIQEHHATRLHWDLRLEHDGVAASWAIPNGIPDDPATNRKAVHTEDHPLEYLDFEGDIPKGQYGAGKMRIWDRGTYELHKWRDREVMVTFHGERVQGRYVLFQTGDDGKDWMIHRMDPAVDPDREPMPEHVVPMLASLAGKLPADESDWAFEIKWDGIRAIAYSSPGRLRLESRNLKEITPRWPELRPLNRELGSHTAVLDGEIVAFDDQGRPSFERLQGRMHLTGESQIKRRMTTVPAVYVLFDLLYLDGHSLMGLPYTERRERLASLELDGPSWRTPAYHPGEGQALLDASASQGLEGVVGKRLGSRYEPGRRGGGWIKVKNKKSQELVIGGWVPGEGRRRDRIGALLMGWYEQSGEDEPRFRFAGKVGTGFDEKELTKLARLLKPLERKKSPFVGRQPQRGAIFAEPRLVAEIEFGEWTAEKILRHPSYKGLRDDRHPLEVTLERVSEPDQPSVEPSVELPNLDKVLYPESGFTKGQVLDYYLRIASVLLPHLRDRPIGPDRDVVDDSDSLASAIDRGGVELHASLSLLGAPDRPTALVFDLDPGEGVGLEECCDVGVRLHGMLDQLGLESFAKSSGSKGLQVCVPLNSEVTYDQTKPFAKAVAETLEQAFPDEVVARTAKTLRTGKVLVDWSRNDREKPPVAVYSLRASEHPTVSTPVTWEQVENAADDLVLEAGDMLDKVEAEGDLFAPVLSTVQQLPRGG